MKMRNIIGSIASTEREARPVTTTSEGDGSGSSFSSLAILATIFFRRESSLVIFS
jgi:hypothetical protein